MSSINYKQRYPHNDLLQSPYDSRDYKFKDLVGTAVIDIPEEYESEDLGWTFDQGQSSMCAPSAYCYLRCLQEHDRSQSELTDKLCPSFNYANRDIGQDYEGMYLRNLCSKGRQGSVLYDRMKYPNTYKGAKEEFKAKQDELEAEAKPFRITKYYTCNSRKEIQQAILKTKGVLLSIPVFDSFYKPNNDGTIEFVPGQKSNGNHAVVVDGWRIINGKYYWRIKNSWGKYWGHLKTGHAYLPEEYPWTDKAFVLIDEVYEMKFAEYQKKYEEGGFKKVSFWTKLLNLFRSRR